MNDDSPDLKTAMLARIRAGALRKVWTPTDFVDLASRDAVDKTLLRQTKAGTLRRIDRGLYDQSGYNKLTQKSNPPDPRSVIDAVPAKIVVHTDARRRAVKLGNVIITFRQTAASKLFWAGRPAMRVVQALHWLRDLLGREGESDQVKRKLAKLFEDPTEGPYLKADLRSGMTALPTWMRVFLKPLIESDTSTRRRNVDDDRADDDHVGADHDRHRQRRSDGDDDQHHAAAVLPKRKWLSTEKTRTAKRGTMGKTKE